MRVLLLAPRYHGGGASVRWAHAVLAAARHPPGARGILILSTANVTDDEHFLTRVERLDNEHAELALALYYDSGLVRHLLAEVELPDATERVAIALDDPAEGPFIIVARDGGFVTCLGRGMRPGADKPVVTRQRLDAIAGRVEGLRRAITEGGTGLRHCRRLIKELLVVGDGLSREKFEQLGRLTPLLDRHYFLGLVRSLDDAHNAYQRVARARRITAPRHAEALRGYWRSVWAMSHFALLLAAAGPQVLHGLFEALEERSPVHVGRRAKLLPAELTSLGVTSFAARGAWVASKIPKTLLPDLKQSWLEPSMPNDVISFGLGLCAIGMRHRKLRAEVHKALNRAGPAGEGPLPAALRKLVAEGYDVAIEASAPLREHMIATGRALLDKVAARMGPAAQEVYARVPDEVAVSMLLALSMSLHGTTTGVVRLIEWLPWLVEAEATDFYVPAAYLPLRGNTATVREAIALVEPRRKHDYPHGASSVAVTEPLRKRPCPCGSGKKYKHCCGANDAG